MYINDWVEFQIDFPYCNEKMEIVYSTMWLHYKVMNSFCYAHTCCRRFRLNNSITFPPPFLLIGKY